LSKWSHTEQVDEIQRGGIQIKVEELEELNQSLGMIDKMKDYTIASYQIKSWL
jgi:hypothetical protein